MKNYGFSFIGILFTMLLVFVTFFTSEVKATSEIRREVSPTSPMYSFLVRTDWDQTVEGIMGEIPSELRPYSVVMMEYVSNKPADLAKVEEQLQYCEDNGIDALLQVRNWAYISDVNTLDTLFETYSSLVGGVVCELSCGSFTQNEITQVKNIIQKCVDNNALFIWREMGYPTLDHPYLIAGEDQGLMDLMRQYKDNIILVEKINGEGQYFTSQATAMGFWLSDICSNWGINAEDFYWYETAFDSLWSDPVHARTYSQFETSPSFPEAMFGQMMIKSMSAGATFYSFEYPRSVIYQKFGYNLNPQTGKYDIPWFADEYTATPTLNKVIAPILEKAVTEAWIPTKEEVFSKTKVAYHAQNKNADEINKSVKVELFRGLYGANYPKSHEAAVDILPFSGRYFFIPIIPKLANTTEINNFTSRGIEVLTPDDFTSSSTGKQLIDLTKKIEYFNSVYNSPEAYGSSWAVRKGDKWFLFNPSENENYTTDFQLLLYTNTTNSLSGVFEPHTFAMIHEESDSLNVYLNNYRADSRCLQDNSQYNFTKVWAHDVELYNTYMDKYVAGQISADTRTSVFTLDGVTGGEPTYTISGDYSSNDIVWDDVNKTYKMTIAHNGPVEIVINATGDGGDPVPDPIPTEITKLNWELVYVDSEELTNVQRPATNAFDGDSSTFWHTEWAEQTAPMPHEIQIDLGAEYNIAQFSYLPNQGSTLNGTIKDYEFYVSMNGTDWGTAIAIGTFASNSDEKVVSFEPIVGRYIKLKALSEVNDNPWTSAAEISVYEIASEGTSGIPFGKTIWLKSIATNQYLTVIEEDSYKVYANSDIVGETEKFIVSDAGDGKVFLTASIGTANKNLKAWGGNTTTTIDTTGGDGEWAQWTWSETVDGKILLESCNQDGYMKVEANSDKSVNSSGGTGEWAQFSWGEVN